MGKTIFITGTGTDVGKTALSLALLLWAGARGLRTAYCKPVQCGGFPLGDPPVMGGDETCATKGRRWLWEGVDKQGGPRPEGAGLRPGRGHQGGRRSDGSQPLGGVGGDLLMRQA